MPPKDSPPRAGATCALTLLATSDLHLNLCPWDHYSDRPAPGTGLISAAGRIARLRRTEPNALLLDNGDFLQGTAVGDAIADSHPPRADQPHPMIEAMNLLGYDAVALGNHDFDYGLEFLGAALAGAQFPALCANLVRTDGGPPLFGGWTVLERRVTDDAGKSWPLRIGLVGVLPPQVEAWGSAHLQGRAKAQGMAETVRRLVPRMIASGAEVVVALCHTGIGTAKGGTAPEAENAALALAAVPGVDAVIAGHTHQLFPGPDFPAGPGIDPQSGHLAGIPAVMPGYAGSHLGVIRLRLERGTDRRWRSLGGTGALVPLLAEKPADPVPEPLAQLCNRLTAATRRHLARPAGRTAIALNTHFALAGDCATTRLTARAMRWHVAQMLQGGPYGDLPVLAAASPSRAGGTAGASNYVDLPAGTMCERDLAALCPYPNPIRALKVTGAGLRDWLEYSARAFRQIAPGTQDAALLDPDWPYYNFDVIEGLTYRIDLSAPPGDRIRDLCHDGAPLRPEADFALATNSYRAAGGGGFPGTGPEVPTILAAPTLVRTIIGAWLTLEGPYEAAPFAQWRFVPMPGTTAVLHTGQGAVHHLPRPGLTPLETGADGFLRVRIAL